jgi:hypothetical protein
MASATYDINFSCGGLTIQKSISRSADHPNPYGPITLLAAKALSSWVKTDANTAAGNLPGGHGYSNGKFDVFWTSGGGGRRYDVDGTIATNALSLDGGSGDNFPASADTTVSVSPQTTINTAIDGDNSKIVAISLEFTDTSETSAGSVLFKDAGTATIAQVDLTANEPKIYDIDGGATNVFTGNPITVAYASNGSTSNDASLKIISLEDSTP